MAALLTLLKPKRPAAAPVILTPAAPTGLTATRETDRVDLAWAAPTDGLTTSWRVQASDDGPDGTFATLDTVTSPAYSDTDAPDDAYRYWRVIAVSSEAVDSDPSVTVGAHRIETVPGTIEDGHTANAATDAQFRTDVSGGSSNDFSSNGTAISIGYVAGSPIRTSAMAVRFTDTADIPADTVFTNLVLRLSPNAGSSNVPVLLKVRGALEANPAAVSSYADAIGRARTTAAVDWDIAASWSTGVDYDSPDLSAIGTELVAQASWAPGNALLFFIEDDGTDRASAKNRAIKSLENVAPEPVQLIATWDVAADIEVDTVAPAAPLNLSGAATSTGVFLSWTANVEDDLHAAPYLIERRLTGVDPWVQIGTSASASYTDTDGALVTDSTYDYRVKARDNADTPNVSVASSVVSVLVEDAPTGDAFTPATLELTRTFRSIGIRLQFADDVDESATLQCEFKKTSDTDQSWNAVGGGWRDTLPLWRWDETLWGLGSMRAYTGSALYLDEGTSYDIKVTITDPDGVAGDDELTGSITTLDSDDIDTPAELWAARTHTLGIDYADFNTALDTAPANAIVGVPDGRWGPPTNKFRSAAKGAITFVAEHPACDDDGAIINVGDHAIIEPLTRTDPADGVWTEHTVASPKDASTITYYSIPLGTALGNGVTLPTDPRQLFYASDLDAQPKRVAHWTLKTTSYADPTVGYTYNMSTSGAEWAKVCADNDTYNYGFAVIGGVLYARFPQVTGSADPDDYYVWVHDARQTGDTKGKLRFQAADCRMSGFEIRMASIYLDGGSDRFIFDHNLTYSANVTQNVSKTTFDYPVDILVESNRMLDHGTWNDEADYATVHWLFVKQYLKMSGVEMNGGTEPSWGKLGKEAETTAVWGSGIGKQLVVRTNHIQGWFNGVGGYNRDHDRESARDFDVYGNTFSEIADNAFEPSFAAQNVRFMDNTLRDIVDALETGPSLYGPLFIVRNSITHGRTGLAQDADGDYGPDAVAYKFSGSSRPPARVYYVHNTTYTDDATPDNGGAASGIMQFADNGPQSERFWMRNNITRTKNKVMDFPNPGQLDEDYNLWYGVNGAKYDLNEPFETIAAYRTYSGQGAHSIGFDTEPDLEDPDNGDLTLAAASNCIDAGTPVANISDRAGVDYEGSAPDLGAFEAS